MCQLASRSGTFPAECVSQKVLWFVDSFGLDYIQSPLRPARVRDRRRSPFEILHRHNKTTSVHKHLLCRTLYLLEQFGISDEFYHELTLANQSLSRSHLVKQAWWTITEPVDILRLPDPFHSVYQQFQHCLAEAIAYEVSLAYCMNKNTGHTIIYIFMWSYNKHSICDATITDFLIPPVLPPKLKSSTSPVTAPMAVKLSGYRARFSKTSSFVLLSFSLPDHAKMCS